MRDRRRLLKVKIKHLAAEAKIIRHEERRTRHPTLRSNLAEHRRTVVRDAARNALLAYGFIRGRTIDQMESGSRKPRNWREILRQVKKYGPAEFDSGLFDAWKQGGDQILDSQ